LLLLLSPVLLRSSGARQAVANGVAETRGVPQHLGWGVELSSASGKKLLMGKSWISIFLGAFLALYKSN